MAELAKTGNVGKPKPSPADVLSEVLTQLLGPARPGLTAEEIFNPPPAPGIAAVLGSTVGAAESVPERVKGATAFGKATLESVFGPTIRKMKTDFQRSREAAGGRRTQPTLSDTLDPNTRQSPSYVPPHGTPLKPLGAPAAPVRQPARQATPAAPAAPPAPTDTAEALDPVSEARKRIDASITRIEELASQKQAITPEEQRFRVLGAAAAGAVEGLRGTGTIAEVLGAAGAMSSGERARILAEEREQAQSITDKLIRVEELRIGTEGEIAKVQAEVNDAAFKGFQMRVALTGLQIRGQEAAARSAFYRSRAGRDSLIGLKNELQVAKLLAEGRPGAEVSAPGLAGVEKIIDLPEPDQPMAFLAWKHINDPTSPLRAAAMEAVRSGSEMELEMLKQTQGPIKAKEYEDGLVFVELMKMNADRLAAGDASALEEIAVIRAGQYRSSPVGIAETLGGPRGGTEDTDTNP